jgi:hypothetical protein
MDTVPVVLVLSMEVVQVCRRLYETLFINVFSKTATMTVLHYVLGFVFYLSISLSVIAGNNFSQLSWPGEPHIFF